MHVSHDQLLDWKNKLKAIVGHLEIIADREKIAELIAEMEAAINSKD